MRRSGSRGMTMMELTAALTVSIVVASMAILSVGPMLRAVAGRSAAQQIAAELRLARMRAIAQNTRFRVVFDTNNASFRVEREATPGNFVLDEGPFTLAGEAGISSVMPADPIFDARGSVNAATTIVAGSYGHADHTINVSLLGRITLS